jgi:hypothetical protein
MTIESNLLPKIRTTTSTLTFANTWDHILARWAFNRMWHRVEPGLYSLGNPTPESPVFVTANYSLSFDAVRSALKGIDSYILVLDTQGVNVWCAAGKGTFGTDELVKRIEESHLHEIVNHRVVILPQLGAPGVAAHEVKKRAHFKVEYGPVRAEDLPEYLKTREATPEMRRVRFTLKDRLILIPVEFVAALIPLLILIVLGIYPWRSGCLAICIPRFFQESGIGIVVEKCMGFGIRVAYSTHHRISRTQLHWHKYIHFTHWSQS